MGITNSNKVINMERIDCDGSLKVTLALTAAPDIVTNPTDPFAGWQQGDTCYKWQANGMLAPSLWC